MERIEYAQLERAVCEILWALETMGVNIAGFSDGTLNLWRDHKAIDARRFAAEQAELRCKALMKLTTEERQALGFPDGFRCVTPNGEL